MDSKLNFLQCRSHDRRTASSSRPIFLSNLPETTWDTSARNFTIRINIPHLQAPGPLDANFILNIQWTGNRPNNMILLFLGMFEEDLPPPPDHLGTTFFGLSRSLVPTKGNESYVSSAPAIKIFIAYCLLTKLCCTTDSVAHQRQSTSFHASHIPTPINAPPRT